METLMREIMRTGNRYFGGFGRALGGLVRALLPLDVVVPSDWVCDSRLFRLTFAAMKTLCVCVLVLFLRVPLEDLQAATVSNATHFPEVVSPGQTVTVVGRFDSTKQKTAVVKLYVTGSETTLKTLTVDVTDNSIAVKLPEDLKPGRYYLALDYDDLTNKLVPGELRVQANAVQLDTAHPATAYSNPNGGFDFDVIGQNFSENPNDDQIYISGKGGIIPSDSRFRQEADCKTSGKVPCLWVESTEKLHVLGYQNEHYQGPLLVSVGVGSARSAQKPLVLSRMSETGVLVTSIAVFLVLGFFIYRLVARGMQDNIIDGKRYSPWFAFFLDKQTNTYSLSKFQFLLFSSVFVFGYLYVFLCRWLVQWVFVLPDVPGSFSAILAMSAGTTVAAAGVTAARGSKGAGQVLPSAADFITTGGQVVPERFQFFVWTLVACFGFLALLISQDPATIIGFPQFPQGLLYVMGVSAGGYLGGKLTRPPGPVIRNIAWDKGNSEITIQGENLSNEGDFFIDGAKLPIDPQAKQNLVKPTPQEQASDRTFCSQLKITISAIAGVDLSTGDHVFRITNKDGQFADARFTVDPPRIDEVRMAAGNPPAAPGGADPKKLIASGKNATVIQVTGSGFRVGTTARWTPANAKDPTDLTASAVEFVNSQTLKITLTPGDPGTGTLMVLTPNGFSATAAVTVV
jgi:hypothetical protein